jgi:2,4-dienoyl-CoA reductase-like NADH-dependent reductase (Old Yellow Enzyme family)
MPKLFEKTWIGSIELANRAVRSATWSGVGDERGYVTDRAVELYRDLARGQVGLIITGYQYIMRNGMQLPFMIGNYEDHQLEGLTRLADAVHAEGGKIIPQIVHCGAQANPKLMPQGEIVWAPSAAKDPVTGRTSHEVTKQEIRQLVEAYASAALRSLNAGFDGVELHAAHGYGINQFLSPAWNKRGDSYGGSLKNRYRFLAEVLEAARGATGDSFPLLIKLSGHDFLEGGLVPQDALEIARLLADDGIAAIEVSGGNAASPNGLGPVRNKIHKPEDEAYFADLSSAMKAAVSVPIVSVGGVRSLKTIDDILEGGKADYVAMSRPFIREPHLVARWQSGDTGKALCISCNGCFETGLTGKGVSCKVEAKLREKREKSRENEDT